MIASRRVQSLQSSSFCSSFDGFPFFKKCLDTWFIFVYINPLCFTIRMMPYYDGPVIFRSKHKRSSSTRVHFTKAKTFWKRFEIGPSNSAERATSFQTKSNQMVLIDVKMV